MHIRDVYLALRQTGRSPNHLHRLTFGSPPFDAVVHRQIHCYRLLCSMIRFSLGRYNNAVHCETPGRSPAPFSFGRK